MDSGATANFIDRDFVETKKLVTTKLQKPIEVKNVDGTLNKTGNICEYVRAFLEIGNHKSTQIFYVTGLGNKDVIIGYSFLYEHNPVIDWVKGDWEFTRCPENCKTERARKTNSFEIDSEQLEEEEASQEDLIKWVSYLETIGEPDEENPYINWIDTNDPNNNVTLEALSTLFDDKDMEEVEDTKDWKTKVPTWVHEFDRVFSKIKSERMPSRKEYDHAIEFLPGAELPKPAKLYPLSPAERISLDEWLNEELRKGYLRPSKSPIAAPFFYVHKPKLRPIMDYRSLNEITVKNRYPIPRINDLIDALSNATVFTKIDLRWGYNNVRIKEGDEWKTAFITQRGLFEALVMYFGFANAPATFQAMMNEIFKDLILLNLLIVYLDDILIYGTDKKEHRKIVKEVLKRLQENDLFAKPEKCFFEQDSIEYLGMIISGGKIAMDPKKLSGVVDWPVPTKVKHVQAFLGFANFYRRFIQDFAAITKPLTNLTTKDKTWDWGVDEQYAFESLKRAFTTAPILKIPDDYNRFRLAADASDFATGAVLYQLDPLDDEFHPVGFYSKSLNEHERNYEIYDKEMLAMIRALEEYRHYLEGHPEQLEIWSDHKNLSYFKATQKFTRRQARWALFLSRFNYILHHKPGTSMQAEDPLSRRPDHEEGVEFDNSNRILLKPEYFAIRAIDSAHETLINDDQLLREIKDALLSDEVTKDYKSLLSSGPREFGKTLQDWNYENGLLLYRSKVYVPRSNKEHLGQRIGSGVKGRGGMLVAGAVE